MVYDAQTGEELAILTHTGDLRFNGYYADDVAIHGDTVAIGNVASLGTDSGYVDLFSLSGESWMRRVEAPEGMPSGWFGTAVELTTDRLYVGAAHGRGRVYVYDAMNGVYLAEIEAPITGAGYFGSSLSADGGRLLVGAPGRGNPNAPPVSGLAYLFDATTGDLLQTFRPDDGDGEDEKRFGRSVALYGDLALVGAPDDSELADYSGAAYLFDVTTGDQIAKLSPSNPTEGGLFGWSVDLNATSALVGAPLNSGSDWLGVAYEFQSLLPGDYDGDGEVTGTDGEAWRDRFGTVWGYLSADGNGDGIVDAADYTIWRDAYQASVSTQQVPEAATLTAVLAGASSLLVGRRRG